MESTAVEYSENAKFAIKDEVKQSAEHVMNGLSNGINDGHHKHKHKDKDKEKYHDKHKHKDKDRDKDKHQSNKEKNSKESSSEKKNKDERKEKEHREKDKEHKDKNKEHKEHREKDKESRDKTKVKEYGEKNKENHDKEHKDKRKDHSEKDKHKEHKSHDSKPKEHKSSNSSGSSSSKTHSSSSSKNKEKHDSSKNKHSSDKPKDKYSNSIEKHSGSHKSSSNKKIEKPNRSITEKPQKCKNLESEVLKKGGINTKRVKESESVKIKDEPYEEDNDSKVDNSNHTADGLMISISSIKSEGIKTESTYNNTRSENTTFYDSEEIGDRSKEWNQCSVKQEAESEEDVPLSKRTVPQSKRKRLDSENEEDDIPLSARKKIKKEVVKKRKKESYSDYEDFSEEDRKPKKSKQKIKKENVKTEFKETASPTKKKKKGAEEEQEVWKWWEEEKKDDGVKWKYLEHKGPMFAPLYEPLPSDIRFYYNGREMKLSQNAEEIATFYARMIEHDYTTKEVFNKNFFKDWRKSMNNEEKEVITDLKKCNFKKMYEYFVLKSEERKAMSKEEKKKIKEQNDEIAKDYGFCTIDGHKEKIGNFRIEPPGLFRGRGEHPKMGKLKKRVVPEDVIINCSKDSKFPVPPGGHKWKEVRHDSGVTWLASWTENVQGQVKYVMLNPSSKLKGEKDWQKYEIARKLAKFINKIRQDYREDWKSKEMRIRQRAVAMYFIDILALRAGNEKDEDQADTVGCCSLRVEHVQLHEKKDGNEYVVVFDFLGKDSIRYYNEVPVEKRVFKNLQLFCERKKGSDDLFDRLNTSVLNKHLNELMEGLTAKVFRTYNASITLQNQLNELTDPNASLPEKLLQYNRANRAVAILCNHQRSVPKSHEKSMGNLKQKIDSKKEQVVEAQKQYKEAKRDAKDGSTHSKMALDKKKKALDRLKEQLMKLEVQETDKEENKTIALGTSKLNYLDPRISVAWCKKYDVPIDKVYNKTQRSKFRWAIDMAGPEFVF